MTETTRSQSPALHEDILDYYARGKEDARLRQGGAPAGRLEFWRTQDVLRRVLPPAPARVLDVGGGSGVHAEWLARDGYGVRLLDPVPLHVEQAARLPGVSARSGMRGRCRTKTPRTTRCCCSDPCTTCSNGPTG